MKLITRCYWLVPDERKPGKWRKSACKLTREDAIAQYGDSATPVEASWEMLEVPEITAEEQWRLTCSGKGR